MVSADTSTWVAYFQGQNGNDVDLLQKELSQKTLLMPPPVLTELLSDPKLDMKIKRFLGQLPLLELSTDFWAFAGELRSILLRKKLKARLGDALIAQSCLENDVPLISRDKDFKNFEKHCHLRVLW